MLKQQNLDVLFKSKFCTFTLKKHTNLNFEDFPDFSEDDSKVSVGFNIDYAKISYDSNLYT